MCGGHVAKARFHCHLLFVSGRNICPACFAHIRAMCRVAIVVFDVGAVKQVHLRSAVWDPSGLDLPGRHRESFFLGWFMGGAWVDGNPKTMMKLGFPPGLA